MENMKDLEKWHEKLLERELARAYELNQVRKALEELKKAEEHIREWGFSKAYKRAYDAVFELYEKLKFEDAK